MINSDRYSKFSDVAGMLECEDEAKEWDCGNGMILSRWWGCGGESQFFLTHQSPERWPLESEKVKDPTTHSSREADKMQWSVDW
jgi:hypothetical protein